jgi:pyruvate/2-oxoacid:ferredoxin oxidoreductase beta subunit
MKEPIVFNYLRGKKRFPHVWCPGCGHGVVMGSLIRAIDKLGLNKDDVARNIDLTVILMNNNIYGMTGGQVSPTTPYGSRGSTARLGNPEHPFDIPTLATAAGASFVARTTAYHVPAMDRIIENAVLNKGFSLVEVYSQCPTYEGKWNKRGDAPNMLKFYKEHSVPVASRDKYTPEQMHDKFFIGVFHHAEKPEFTQEYQNIIDKLRMQETREELSNQEVKNEQLKGKEKSPEKSTK